LTRRASLLSGRTARAAGRTTNAHWARPGNEHGPVRRCRTWPSLTCSWTVLRCCRLGVDGPALRRDDRRAGL